MNIECAPSYVALPLGAESAKPQMLLFSVTVPYWVREVADKYMSHDRVVVDLIGGESLKTAVSVEHKAICCPYAERPSTIADVIQVKIENRLLYLECMKKWMFSSKSVAHSNI